MTNKVELFIEVTHAHNGSKADILKSKIFGWQYSEPQQCVIIYSDAGAVFPVRESVEYFRGLFSNKVTTLLPPLSSVHGFKSSTELSTEYLCDYSDTNRKIYTDPTNL